MSAALIIAELRREVDELRQDKARLDWLINEQMWYPNIGPDHGIYLVVATDAVPHNSVCSDPAHDGPIVRAAIDKLRAK